MQLLGVSRSLQTRRIAITLRVHGVQYELSELPASGGREELNAPDTVGHMPALVADVTTS